MKGSQTLKITGIIMIIGAAILILLAITGFVIGTFESVSYVVAGGLLMLISIIGLIGSVIQLVAGIMGVKNWDKPEKAQHCVIMGIIIIVLSVINNAITIYIDGFSANSVSGVLIGLVLPCLYTYGALQLKKSA